MKRAFRVLSVDGGGVRGIYAATLLKYFEEKLDQPIHKYFDLVVGASTGGIIALGVALGLPSENVYLFYKNHVPKVFKKTWRIIQGGFILPKYSPYELENTLKKVFGESVLRDAKCRVCIPTIDGSNGKNKVFKTRHLPIYINDDKIKMWKLAMATSAAPYYFPAFRNANMDFIDGGFWANNPTLVGIAEAIRLGIRAKNIQVLSMGSGNVKFKRRSWKLKYGLAISWGPKLLDLAFNTQAQAIENEARYILSDKNFFRYTFPLEINASLDDVKSMGKFEKIAEESKDEIFNNAKETFFDSFVDKFHPLEYE